MTIGPVRSIAAVLPLVLAFTGLPRTAQGEDLVRVPLEATLVTHVQTLASPAFQGRRGPGARRAASYILDAWKTFNLKPLFDTRFTQDVVDEATGLIIGQNLGAIIPGSDPALEREWVLLGVHYDHLGVHRGVVFPGADDNASSVAMMLEVARCLSQAGPEFAPRRTIVFMAFDLEEDGLVGSQYFVNHPPRPLEDLKLMVTGDMLSRALGGVCKSDLYAMGTEFSPGIREPLRRASVDMPLTLKMIGNDMLAVDRSDYGPFRRRHIPFLFLSTGENPTYHTPDDRPETIDAAKLAAASQLVFKLLTELLNQKQLPPWSDQPTHELSEAEAIRDTLRQLVDHAQELKLNVLQTTMIRGVVRDLDAAIGRGQLTGPERQKLVTQAQVILYSIL